MKVTSRISVLSTAVLLLTGVVAAPAAAEPGPQCAGTRAEARKIGDSGEMVESAPTPVSAWDGSDPEPALDGLLGENTLAAFAPAVNRVVWAPGHVVAAAVERANPVSDPTVLDFAATVVLRYSPSRQCAWGLISLNREWDDLISLPPSPGPSLWLDTSNDEGQSVTSGMINRRHVQSRNSSTYTATSSMAPQRSPISMRACGEGLHTHMGPGKRAKLKLGFSIRIHTNGIVCTDWVTVRP
ncbi:hypothetical protein [Actinoplanes solisilvae]|uniref:hypothetical protein n=1 Tax=Actinoplanes solisilvae TaxID=2486853 RepID=UPI000FDC407B|nr:hypothetical protein [Actinoplanes solisilvae]